MKKNSHLWQIIVAIALALLVGSLSDFESQWLGVKYIQLFQFLGELFLNLLTLLTIPLVASALISGSSQLGKERSLGKLGIRVFSFYGLTTLLAILTGLLWVNWIQPGSDNKLIGEMAISLDTIKTMPKNYLEMGKELLLKLFPNNIFEAAGSGNMLAILFFSLLFGFALARIHPSKSEILTQAIEGLFSTLMEVTRLIVKGMPLAVFFLVSASISSKGINSLRPILLFCLTVLGGLTSFMFLVLPLLFKLMGLNPWRYLRAMGPALLTAFSTSSSLATLPITLDSVQRRAGVSKRISNMVIPLGCSMNMAGSALYECAALLFISQLYGISLSFLDQIMLIILSLLASVGVAGVPSGGIVAILLMLKSMGIPTEAVALILPVDRFLDMFRTMANVLSDGSCAIFVAKKEGEAVG